MEVLWDVSKQRYWLQVREEEEKEVREEVEDFYFSLTVCKQCTVDHYLNISQCCHSCESDFP